MFQDPIQLHFTKATARTETNNDVATAVTAVGLVLDSLTPNLAGDLSDEIRDLCFTSRGQIRDEITKLDIRLREAQQHITIRMAKDVSPHVELRHVRVSSIGIVKRGEDPGEEVERKSKKIAPAAETLRATFNCLVLPESHAVREFLLCMIGKTFFLEFEDEQKQLEFGETQDGDDDPEERQEELTFTGPRLRKGRRTKAETEGLTDAAVAEALSQAGIELKPKQLAAMTATQRSETLAWVDTYQKARADNASELPPPPSYVLNPAELTAAGDVLEDAPKPKAAEKSARARAPRRSAAQFKNSPRIAKAKKPKKGKK